MNNVTFYSLVFFVSTLISVIAVPLIIKFSKSANMFDTPNSRKEHKKKISRLGGFGIFFSFILTFLLFKGYTDFSFNIHIYLSAVFAVFIMGVYDDIKDLRARHKLAVQILAGLIVGFSGLRFEQFNFLDLFTLEFGLFSYIITSLWIVSFINAINLIDGIDGLASGIVMIASLFIFIIGIMQGIYVASFFSILLIGSITGFYIYNFPPARIFMGDGGSYLLGFVCATIPLMGIQKASVVNILLVPFILLIIPISDVLNVIISRLRHKKHIFTADKSHIHHRLRQLGFSNRQILLLIYTMNILLGLLSVLMVQINPALGVYILIIVFLGLSLGFYIIYTIEKNLAGISRENESPKQGKECK